MLYVHHLITSLNTHSDLSTTWYVYVILVSCTPGLSLSSPHPKRLDSSSPLSIALGDETRTVVKRIPPKYCLSPHEHTDARPPLVPQVV